MLPTLLRPLVPIGALALAASLPPLERASAPDVPRPVVLLVHGRGQAARDTAELRRELRQALQRGAREVAGDTLLGDDDVRLVWYADAVGTRGGTGEGCAPRLAREEQPQPDESPRALLTVLAVAAEAFLDLADAPANDETRELRSLFADLHYLGEPSARCAAEQRLGAALARARAEKRPVIVVAHSFGAIVSWGHLTRAAGGERRDGTRIERLVTVGSPLASPEVRRLVFGGAKPLAPPPGVASWVNVVDEGDGLAVPLAGDDSLPLPATMRDVRTASGRADTHDFGDYLRDPATARAIGAAWCSASGRNAPAACAATREARRD